MQTPFLWLGTFALLIAACGCGRAPSPPGQGGRTRADDSLRELARRYRGYRQELKEDPSTAPPELRDWKGPVHDVMSRLGEGIAASRCSEGETLALLGPPDETFAEGEDYNGKPVPAGQKYLVYWWRGGHDCLCLVLQNGSVVASKWYHAYE